MDADLTHLTAAEEIFAAECLKAAISEDFSRKKNLLAKALADIVAERLNAELTRYAVTDNREISKLRAELEKARAAAVDRYNSFLSDQAEVKRLFSVFTGPAQNGGQEEDAPTTEEIMDKAAAPLEKKKRDALKVICDRLGTVRNDKFGAAYAEYNALKGKLDRLAKDDPERAEAEKTLAQIRPSVAEWDRLTKQIWAMEEELERRREAWVAARTRFLKEYGDGRYHGPYDSITTTGGPLKQKIESLDNELGRLAEKDFTLAGKKEEIAALVDAFRKEINKSFPGKIFNAIKGRYKTLDQKGPLAITTEQSGRIIDYLTEKIFDKTRDFNVLPRFIKDKAMTEISLPSGGTVSTLDAGAIDPAELAKIANGFVEFKVTEVVNEWMAKVDRGSPATGFGNINKSDLDNQDPGNKKRKNERPSWTELEKKNTCRIPNQILQAAVREVKGILASDSYTMAFLAAFRKNVQKDRGLKAPSERYLAAFPDAEAKKMIGHALQVGAQELTFPGVEAFLAARSNWFAPAGMAAYKAVGGDKVVSRTDKDLFRNMAVSYICAPVFEKMVPKLEDEAKRVAQLAKQDIDDGIFYAKEVVELWESAAALANAIAVRCRNQNSSGQFGNLMEVMRAHRRASVVAALLRTARIARRIANDWLEQRIRFLTKGTPPATGDAKCNQPLAPFRRGC